MNVVAGSKQDREGLVEQALEADVLITSYPLLRRDADWYAGIGFHALILDEAQEAIKNQASLTAQNVKELQAAHRSWIRKVRRSPG